MKQLIVNSIVVLVIVGFCMVGVVYFIFKVDMISPLVSLPLNILRGKRTFQMAVFVDENSYKISDQEISEYFDFTSQLLHKRTGVHLKVINNKAWRVRINKEAELETVLKATINNNLEAFKRANGFVFFSSIDPDVKQLGGSAWSYYKPFPDYCNTFSFDKYATILYGSIIDWGHKFGRCGYDDNGNLISRTSVDGECRNAKGTECVMKFGYSMCKTLTGDYYASDPRLMTASTIIHEIMHHFGGVHYGTAKCNSRAVPLRTFFCQKTDRDNLSDCYFQMCPYVFENFKNAVNICK